MTGVDIFFAIVVLIISVVIHEVSHGYAAYAQGDPTAAMQGRLTLNPIKHLDLFGSIVVPGLLLLFQTPFVIGWAKPVPYNPYNLRNQKWGEALVAVAGPASNILLALLFGFAIRFIGPEILGPLATTSLSIVVLINLVLAVFNLIPVPPLDGSKILFTFLPAHLQHIRQTMEQYGLVLIIVVLFFLAQFIAPIVLALFRLITGIGLPV